MARFSRTREQTKRGRELRQNMTKAEARLWRYLRSAQMGASFRRQHPIGPYFADFCCTSLRIVIELDGGQHAQQAAYDAARTAFLERKGYAVLRFWNNDVMEALDGVCEQIGWMIQRRQWEMADVGEDPLPTSPLEGEED